MSFEFGFFRDFNVQSDFIDICFTAHFGILKMSDRKAIRSKARQIAGALNRQNVLIFGSDSGVAIETASECGSDTC